MEESAFQQFRLVGGTALALQMGHRISIDLDLFTNEDFDSNAIISALEPIGRLEILVDKPPFLQVRLDDVKVDFLKYPYPFFADGVEVDGVRLTTVENIAVMKLLAIARRGVKKDFYDLYFMLEQFNMAEIVVFFKEKVPNVDMFHIFKSLTYFGDADGEADPKMLKKVSWTTVKKTISKKVETYLNEKI